jgi:hypothetical protein
MTLSMQAELIANQEIAIEVNLANRDAAESVHDADEYKQELLRCASSRRTWDTPDWFGYKYPNPD